MEIWKYSSFQTHSENFVLRKVTRYLDEVIILKSHVKKSINNQSTKCRKVYQIILYLYV